jgi:hypothetical protein
MFTYADVLMVKKDLPKTCSLFEKMYELHEQHVARELSNKYGLIESGRVTEEMITSIKLESSLSACIISQLEKQKIPWNFNVLEDLEFYVIIQSCELAKKVGEEIPDEVEQEQVAFLASYKPSLSKLFTPQIPSA